MHLNVCHNEDESFESCRIWIASIECIAEREDLIAND